MTLIQLLWALSCVIAISAGQLLFKVAGMEIMAVGSWESWKVLRIVGIAAIIYGLTTLLWIHLLSQVPLNKAYVIMASSFILVPLSSHFLFHEVLTIGYLIGAVIIFLGIVVATQFG